MTAIATPTTPEDARESARDPRAAGVTEYGEIVTEFDRPTAGVVERLARLPIANISDAMNKHGVLHHELRPLQTGARACGPALTCGSVDLTVKIFAQSLVQPGDVFVLAAGGVRDYACLGELSANMLVQKGAAGAVVDGAVRDLTGIREVGLPVFACAVTPHNYHYPFGQPYGSVNLPVICAGIVVNPGDVVVADDDGVVIVPRQLAAEVATAAEQIEQHESGFRTAIRSGQLSPDRFEQELRDAGYVIR
jgi:4-hydroxy-4-methyl-2-oxoglutarate aldolase